MPIRPIVKFGDPVLHAPAAPVDRIDDEIRSLLDDMIATMYAAPGAAEGRGCRARRPPA